MDKCWVTTAIQIFPRISLTEVQELNLSDDPCNPDLEYNFQACVKENLASQVKKHKLDYQHTFHDKIVKFKMAQIYGYKRV